MKKLSGNKGLSEKQTIKGMLENIILTERLLKKETIKLLSISKLKNYNKMYFGSRTYKEFFDILNANEIESKSISIKKEKFELVAREIMKQNDIVNDLREDYHNILDLLFDNECDFEKILKDDKYSLNIKIFINYIKFLCLKLQEEIKTKKQNELDAYSNELFDKKDYMLVVAFICFEFNISGYSIAKTKLKKLKPAILNHRNKTLNENKDKIINALTIKLKKCKDKLEIAQNKNSNVVLNKKKEIQKLNNKISNIEKQLKTAILQKKEEEKNNKAKIKKLKEAQINLEKELLREKATTKTKIDERKKENDALLQKVTDENRFLQKQLQDINKENFDMKNKLEELNISSIENLLKDYLSKNPISDNLYQIMYQGINEYENTSSVRLDDDYTKDTIGRVLIKDNKHYVIIKDCEYELKNISDNIYLAQDQFIKVDSNKNFVEAYSFYFTKSACELQVKRRGILIKGDKLEMILANQEIISVKNPNNYKLKKDIFIGINSSNEIVRIYSYLPYNKDNFLKSALIRNQKAYIITKIFNPTTLSVRDLDTNEELPLSDLEYSNELKEMKKLEETNVIFVKDNKITNILNSRFCTNCASYNLSKIGYVISTQPYKFSTQDQNIYNFKLDIDTNLKEGDQIVVDEFDKFIKKLSDSDFDLEKPQIIKKSSNKDLNDNIDSSPIQIKDKDILIIGNPNLSESYKLKLYKEGYRVDTINGYNKSFKKIKKAAKKADFIIFITTFASHSNMYELKKLYPKKLYPNKIEYTDNEGVNRIIELLNEKIA